MSSLIKVPDKVSTIALTDSPDTYVPTRHANCRKNIMHEKGGN